MCTTANDRIFAQSDSEGSSPSTSIAGLRENRIDALIRSYFLLPVPQLFPEVHFKRTFPEERTAWTAWSLCYNTPQVSFREMRGVYSFVNGYRLLQNGIGGVTKLNTAVTVVLIVVCGQ